MAIRRGAPRGVTRGPRRQTDWAFALLAADGVAIPAASKVLLASIASSVLSTIAPATIVRTRGLLTIRSDQSIATELQLGAMGVAFVNEVARGLGVTALPGPSTEALWDGWFVHQFISQAYEFVSGVGTNPQYVTQYMVDSKAMRKFESDEGLVFMVENAHAATGFVATLQLRLLLKAG